MRTTLNIEDDLVVDLMRLTQAPTRTQAVRNALTEYIRLRHKEEFLALRGCPEIQDDEDIYSLEDGEPFIDEA